MEELGAEEVIESVALDDSAQKEPITIAKNLPCSLSTTDQILLAYLKQRQNSTVLLLIYTFESANLLEDKEEIKYNQAEHADWVIFERTLSQMLLKMRKNPRLKCGIMNLNIMHDKVTGHATTLLIFPLIWLNNIKMHAIYLDANGIYYNRTDRIALMMKKFEMILESIIIRNDIQFDIPNRQELNSSFSYECPSSSCLIEGRLCQWISLILTLRFIMRIDRLNSSTYRELMYASFDHNLSQKKMAANVNRIYWNTVASKDKKTQDRYKAEIPEISIIWGDEPVERFKKI